MKKEKTVFILENDEALTIIFKNWLEEAGYRVESAKTIQSARDLLASIPPPSLFWLDYYLNERELGTDFVEIVRANPILKDVPIIVVSITIDTEKIEINMDGIAKFFSKSVSSHKEILSGIKELIGD